MIFDRDLGEFEKPAILRAGVEGKLKMIKKLIE